MNSKRICPFYGKSSKQCDVGYGYISPYHVEVMVRHCLSNYEACGNYRTLTCREREGRTADAGSCGAGGPGGGSPFPLQLDREVFTAVQHAIRTALTSICSFSEILLDYPIDDVDAQRRFLQIIYDEAKRLSQNLDVVFGKINLDTKANVQLAADSVDESIGCQRIIC